MFQFTPTYILLIFYPLPPLRLLPELLDEEDLEELLDLAELELRLGLELLVEEDLLGLELLVEEDLVELLLVLDLGALLLVLDEELLVRLTLLRELVLGAVLLVVLPLLVLVVALEVVCVLDEPTPAVLCLVVFLCTVALEFPFRSTLLSIVLDDLTAPFCDLTLDPSRVTLLEAVALGLPRSLTPPLLLICPGFLTIPLVDDLVDPPYLEP